MEWAGSGRSLLETISLSTEHKIWFKVHASLWAKTNQNGNKPHYNRFKYLQYLPVFLKPKWKKTLYGLGMQGASCLSFPQKLLNICAAVLNGYQSHQGKSAL